MNAPRSEMCECLAAWVDSEPCICNEPIGAPAELSAEKLRQANHLVREVREMDRALAYVAKHKPYCRTRIWYDIDNNRVEVSLPPDITLGLIRTMRFQALVRLSETGVVSTSKGHRPVVSA